MMAATGTRAQEFRDQLSRRVLVADGAMGTMLYSRGVFINRCFDELNLSAPDLVRQIHQEYVKAGAEILETNTFGANRVRLAAFGMAEKLREINRAGVRLAREAARDDGLRGRRRRTAGRAHRAARPHLLRRSAGRVPRTDRRAGGSRRRPADPRNLRQPGRAARGRARRRTRRRRRRSHRRPGHHRRFRPSARRRRSGNLHPRDGLLAGGRDRPELLGGPEGHARNHRADDAVFLQADERHAQRRLADARGGPQHLSLLAGVHGAVRAPPAVGRRENHRRLLRHHAGSHQADPLGDALAAAGAQERWR